MNTLAFEQFENLDAKKLTTIHGGGYKDYGRCFAASEGGALGAEV
ncbi:ComC/BlpC family peptide pheromone/bacteriocin [Streptococcus mutans]|nr:ComC/BlpC family peptide pheromone/bacteriocin [Streptococcus mutans]MDW5564808.1 ComC/BlpC family peptide pheromone/bacteriocin [Streptococcus mutans]